MKTSDFDYALPPEYIAQFPVVPRDASRLLVLHRDSGRLEHSYFRDIGRFLCAGDLLVFNNTRVIMARLLGHKAITGGKAELLLLRRRAPRIWEALAGGHGLQPGMTVNIDGTPGLHVTVRETYDGALRLVEFSQPVTPLLETVGHVPLPPYIHARLADRERYQTVYGRVPGSAAAPTAGLHFTPELIERLQADGVEVAYVTLHVGLDTFAPVTEPDASEHAMHGEWCEIPPQTAESITRARSAGRRVIAVGTTTVRTLESAPARSDSAGVAPMAESTNLFILPGYGYRVVDAMITNFHLPRSTLLMLVSAFAGRERMLAAYEAAKREGYRFYSFGDAMLIV